MSRRLNTSRGEETEVEMKIRIIQSPCHEYITVVHSTALEPSWEGRTIRPPQCDPGHIKRWNQSFLNDVSIEERENPFHRREVANALPSGSKR